jgi:hypothetical protein
LLILVLGIAVASTSFAHNYLPAEPGASVTVIPDIGVSRAAYRTLSVPGQVDIYEFSAKKGQEIYIQMTVPLLDREHGFAPEFSLVFLGDADAAFGDAVVTKGTLGDTPPDVLDRIHPHEGGDGTEPLSLAVGYDGSAQLVFDEPFTGTQYWIRQTLTIAAPADGTYRIGVYTRDGSTGKYVLAPGQKEQFGLGDIFSLPSVIIDVRTFCEVPVWPDYLLFTTLGILAIGGIGVGIFFLATM